MRPLQRWEFEPTDEDTSGGMIDLATRTRAAIMAELTRLLDGVLGAPQRPTAVVPVRAEVSVPHGPR